MRRKIVFSMLCVLLCYGGSVQAYPITVAINGSVTSAGGSALPSTIYAGVGFTGIYTYDFSTINTSVFGNQGRYVHNSPYGIEILLGGFWFVTVSSHIGQFEVGITNSISNWDWYKIISNENATTNGTLIESISWILGGPGSTISTIVLPVSEPVTIVEITDWTNNVLEISGQNLLIQGTVTQAEIIPEPLTGALMAIGVFFLKRRG